MNGAKVVLIALLIGALAACGGSPTGPSPEEPTKLEPIQGLRLGFFYGDLSSLETVGDFTNWMLTAITGIPFDEARNFSKRCKQERIRISYTLIEGGQSDAAWEKSFQEAKPYLEILAADGVLDSVYVADEPENVGLSHATVADRNARVHALGYKTFVVGNTHEAGKRPPGTDFYGFSCYAPGFSIAQCAQYMRESQADILLVQSFYGGPFGKSMPDQIAWARIALDPDVRPRLKGVIFWLWPNFKINGIQYIGSQGDPAAIATQRTIAGMLDIRK